MWLAVADGGGVLAGGAPGRSVALPRLLSLRTPSPRAVWLALPEPTTFEVTIDAGGLICPLDTSDIGDYAHSEPG